MQTWRKRLRCVNFGNSALGKIRQRYAMLSRKIVGVAHAGWLQVRHAYFTFLCNKKLRRAEFLLKRIEDKLAPRQSLLLKIEDRYYDAIKTTMLLLNSFERMHLSLYVHLLRAVIVLKAWILGRMKTFDVVVAVDEFIYRFVLFGTRIGTPIIRDASRMKTKIVIRAAKVILFAMALAYNLLLLAQSKSIIVPFRLRQSYCSVLSGYRHWLIPRIRYWNRVSHQHS